MRAVALLLMAATPAAQEVPSWTRAQMESDLGQLTRALRGRWAYADDRVAHDAVDLDGLRDAAIARLDQVRSDADFVAVVRELVAGIHDGHAFVTWTGREPMPFRRWPFAVVDTADGLVVERLLPTWNGCEVEARPGDVVVEVDGEQVEAKITRRARRQNASAPGARRRAAVHSAQYNETDPSSYVVVRDGVGRVAFTAHAAAGNAMGPEPEPMVAYRRLRDDVAYVRVSTLAFADQQAWREASADARDGLLAADVARLRQAFAAAVGARALVLDLRGNGGGTDLLGMEVAACLLPDDSIYYSLSSRRRLFGGWSKPRSVTLRTDGGAPEFDGQLLVLIDAGTFSAADNLARCLDDLHGDVTFVGRTTGAGTGAPLAVVTLEHSGVVVGCCTMRVYGPGGELIEGRGTRPDIPVTRTRAGVVAGRDEDLEAALAAVR